MIWDGFQIFKTQTLQALENQNRWFHDFNTWRPCASTVSDCNTIQNSLHRIQNSEFRIDTVSLHRIQNSFGRSIQKAADKRRKDFPHRSPLRAMPANQRIRNRIAPFKTQKSASPSLPSMSSSSRAPLCRSRACLSKLSKRKKPPIVWGAVLHMAVIFSPCSPGPQVCSAGYGGLWALDWPGVLVPRPARQKVSRVKESGQQMQFLAKKG